VNKIVIGQRFMSEAEPELGLGLVAHVESKSIKINFKGSNSERNYSLVGAPIRRVRFQKGDEVILRNGQKIIVNELSEEHGLIRYHSHEEVFDETEISDSMTFSKPEDRLLMGQIDHANLFNLRLKTIEHKNRVSKSVVSGLIGPRLSLLPHQYYVATSVADRLIPRVLLADEVGLGKTIEAGLIIHKLLITERVKRVLILVPDSLVYQWFIEMLKKFNLHFATLNQETHLEPNTNPFFDNELVVVNIGLLKGAEMARDMIKKVEWDLLVVDEAHQLKWSENQPSIEYKIAEMVARRSKGLLLLTATPEQMGLEGHFARLKLIDPNRFYDYSKFLEENSHYADVAKTAHELIKTNENGINDEKILELQDLHGTGRIFFRNTREKMANEYSFFPKRVLHSYPLESSKTHFLSIEDEETIGPSFDLKFDWLVQFLEKFSNQKVLLITKSKTKVLCLEKMLKDRMAGSSLGVFHSGLSFIARDRQAQLFRDPNGFNVLLCTEVGSEGRNFEFAHHLILFDLPIHPDLLEQRIGRLDRIGQKKDINIHVPFCKSSYEEILFSWYDTGLNAFAHCAKGAGIVHLELQSLLQDYLEHPEKCLENRNILKDFLANTKNEYHKVTHGLEEGRDILVELNSFNEKIAHEVVKEIKSFDEESILRNYMFEVFAEFGVDIEDIEEDIYYIHPSDNMFVPYFPSLDLDGKRITFVRKIAIAHEDVEFLTWDHPMVVGVVDLILGNNFGNSSAMTRKESKDKAKTFIECFFKLDIVAPRNLSPDRFVSLSSIRVLVDSSGEDFSEKFSRELIESKITPIEPNQVQKLKSLPKTAVLNVVKKAHGIALNQAQKIKEAAILQMETLLHDEEHRLKLLKEKNPVVREEEILAIENRIKILRDSYQNADVALDSIRIIF
jgi:ATP-dependent helicase HepA